MKQLGRDVYANAAAGHIDKFSFDCEASQDGMKVFLSSEGLKFVAAKAETVAAHNNRLAPGAGGPMFVSVVTADEDYVGPDAVVLADAAAQAVSFAPATIVIGVQGPVPATLAQTPQYIVYNNPHAVNALRLALRWKHTPPEGMFVAEGQWVPSDQPNCAPRKMAAPRVITGQRASRHTFITTSVENLGLFVVFTGCMRPVVDTPQFSWHDQLAELATRSAERQHYAFMLLRYLEVLEPLWTNSQGAAFETVWQMLPLWARGYTAPGRCVPDSEGWSSLQCLNVYPGEAGGKTPFFGLNKEGVMLKIETTGAIQMGASCSYTEFMDALVKWYASRGIGDVMHEYNLLPWYCVVRSSNHWQNGPLGWNAGAAPGALVAGVDADANWRDTAVITPFAVTRLDNSRRALWRMEHVWDDLSLLGASNSYDTSTWPACGASR
jgi:hypothetical protein